MSQARPVGTPAAVVIFSHLSVRGPRAHAFLWSVLRPRALCRRHFTGGGYMLTGCHARSSLSQ
eukprot:5449741-Pyramimonas_sp.AAC.1